MNFLFVLVVIRKLFNRYLKNYFGFEEIFRGKYCKKIIVDKRIW